MPTWTWELFNEVQYDVLPQGASKLTERVRLFILITTFLQVLTLTSGKYYAPLGKNIIQYLIWKVSLL